MRWLLYFLLIGMTAPISKAQFLTVNGQEVYESECWYVDPAPYNRLPNFPSSGLSAYSTLLPSEPINGYPYHSGVVKGVSDTVAIIVVLHNHDTTDFVIGSSQPQNWFMPVIYNPMMNPNKFDPFADTTLLKYSFQGWLLGFSSPVSPPSILPKGNRTAYSLLYYIWNLPVGRSRLLMKGTANLPSNVTEQIDYVKPVWVAEPKILADTLNAFVARSWRAYFWHNYTTTLSLCDNMLAINPRCVPAYLMQGSIYGSKAMFDSLAYLNSLDSTISILQRYGDSALGDTTMWDIYQWHWYNANLNNAIRKRNWLINGQIHDIRL